MPDCIDPAPTYLRASWKGVPFICEESSDEFGRRGHLYEYPLSDRIGYKDLGRKARKFSVKGYLIGGDQVAQTRAMALAAESPEPGILVHPAYGSQRCACVRLTTSLDYYGDKRRTKLDFDFVEASDSMAPFVLGTATANVFAVGSAAVAAASLGYWNPNEGGATPAYQVAREISLGLARLIEPAIDEDSFDAISKLERGIQPGGAWPELPAVPEALASMGFPVFRSGAIYQEFAEVFEPIDHGSAVIRLIHADALERLREFNRQIVDAGISGNVSVETLIIAARLTLARDYALVAIQTRYTTVSEALESLDFVMAIYDEEEDAATRRCDDKLVTAIRAARAEAARQMLAANIRLPGIVEPNINGVWPSLLAAHKIYADGTRYEEVERYNPTMPPFFIGREVTAPAR